MNEEIKKILDRLERIDHKENICSFEFADSSTFDEVCDCWEERKKLANYIIDLQQAKDKLQNDYQEARDRIDELQEENKELNDDIIWWKNRFYGQQIYDESYKVLSRDYKERIDKALELLNELLSSTKGVINDYSYYKEHNKILIELLREDEQAYIKLLEILGDKE